MYRLWWIPVIIPLVLTPMIAAQTAPAHAAPTPHLGWQPSLVDSFKQGSSPRGIDCGQRTEEIRNVLVESTIKSYEYWIAAVCLSLNVALFFYVLYLDSVRRHVIRSTARLLAVYQSQLANGQRSYLRLNQELNKFVTQFEQEKEPRVSTRPPVQKARSADDTKSSAAEPRATSLPTRLNHVVQVGLPPEPSAATAPSDETVASLRQQITTLTHQVEQERQKNRKLRGE